MAILQKPQDDEFGFFDINDNERLPEQYRADGTRYPAKILNIVDKHGIKRAKFKKPSETETVSLTSFLFAVKTPDGRWWKYATLPMRISGHPRSTLFKLLAGILGKRPEYGWDYVELEGAKCDIGWEKDYNENTGEEFLRLKGWPRSSALPPAGYAFQPPAPQPTPPPQPRPPEMHIADDDNADDEIPF